MKIKLNRKSKVGKFASSSFALAIVLSSLAQQAYASDITNTTNDNEIKVEEKSSDDFASEVEKAKADLRKYLEKMNKDSIDNPAVIYEDEAGKEKINAIIKRAEELLADENIDNNKLEEIKKIPFKKVNGKKSGSIRDLSKKAILDFTVLGKRDYTNPHNNKAYTSLNNNKILIKTSLKDVKKIGESDKAYIKLNYVSEDDYKAIKVDGLSAATPKYNKQEVPASDYTVSPVEGGYEINILKVPAKAKFIKPIILLKIADGTFFENGDLVYVNNKSNEEKPKKQDSLPKNLEEAKKDLKKYIESFNESAIDNPAINYEKGAKEEIKALLNRSKQLLDDKEIDEKEYEEIVKIPFRKIAGKKSGLFRDLTHKALVDFKVEGERNHVNPHNNKAYTSLKNNKIFIKTSLKNAKKSGEDKNAFIKLNYVTEDQYKAQKVDGVSAATPKYAKQELPAKDYKLEAKADGYEITIQNLPKNVRYIKPVVLVKLADNTYFENGDLVYAGEERPNSSKAEKIDAKTAATEKKEEKVKADKKAKAKVDAKSEATKGKKEAAKPNEKVDAKSEATKSEKENTKSKDNVKTGIETSFYAIATLAASTLALAKTKKKK